VAPVVDRQVAVVVDDITRIENGAGESVLGDLVADAQRSAMHSDVAFITTGTLRADLAKGNASWGDLFAIQPFSGTVVSVHLTGRQIIRALERQWEEPLPPHNLAVSGLTYTYDAGKPAGNRVRDVMVGNIRLDEEAQYSAAMMDYLFIGGDGYTAFTEGTLVATGPLDVDALASYLGSLPQPVQVTPATRIHQAA
jgi:5'-nucleotidase